MLADKVRERDREQIRALKSVLLRLTEKVGKSQHQLGVSLGWPVGVGAALRQLEERGLAYCRNELWYRGADPDRRILIMPLPEVPPVVTTPSPEPVRRPPPAVKGSIRDRVLADLQEHPETGAADIARRLGLSRPSVSNALQSLSGEKPSLASKHGEKRYARWMVTPAGAAVVLGSRSAAVSEPVAQPVPASSPPTSPPEPVIDRWSAVRDWVHRLRPNALSRIELDELARSMGRDPGDCPTPSSW